MNHRSPEIESENNPYNGGGRNILMYIGIDAYTHWLPLNNAVRDATTLKEVLVSKYQFREEHCLPFLNEQATRQHIIDQLDNFCTKGSSWFLGEDDNLILYYSGHGMIAGTRGYWAPIDGSKSTATMISNADVHDRLKDIQARHIYLIIDSCYAGSFVKRSEENPPTQFVENMLRLPSRRVLASGRAGEQVSDGVEGKHSPFAYSLLTYLRSHTEGPLVAKKLEVHVEETTPKTYAGQQPISAYLYELNHQDGQFVFFPKRDESREWKSSIETNTQSAYEQFITNYPDSIHREEAKNRIHGLKAQAHWNRIWHTPEEKRLVIIKEYVRLYEDLPSETEYLRALREAKRLEDVSIWNKVDKSKEYSIRLFLIENPDNVYHEEAKKILKSLLGEKISIDPAPAPEPVIPATKNLELRFMENIVTPAPEKKVTIKKPASNFGKIALGLLGIVLTAFMVYKLLVPKNAVQISKETAIEEIEYDMVPVQGGSFQMGSEEYDDEKPIHTVNVPDFQIAKYEVTQAQWQALMGNNPSNFKGCDQCPVENVSWDDIQEFLQKLNKLTGKIYRLPSEAEWEYAALGGRMSKGYTYAGSNDAGIVAWYDDNAGPNTHPVGLKSPNELGLYDMSGNVWEWCEDDWHSNYQGAPVDGSAWVDKPRADFRVLRGGSWVINISNLRPSGRSGYYPSDRLISFGFRVVRH